MKEWILGFLMLTAGAFGWFVCRHLDSFMDRYRKARRKHQDDNLPGQDD